MPAKPKKSEAQLLQAAAMVFAARGFHRATLDDVAGAVGVTKGTVYGRWRSKDALFLAVLEERTSMRVRALAAVFATPEANAARGPVRARLVAEHLQRALTPDPLLGPLVAIAAAEPAFRPALARQNGRVRAEVEGLLAACLADSPLPHDELAAIVCAAADGLAIEGRPALAGTAVARLLA